jgi:outer membrane receptor for ferrienterochelin and colicins
LGSSSLSWPGSRPRGSSLLNGEVSISGAIGGTNYTLSLRNDSFRNGNAGPETVYTPDGTILDIRDEMLDVRGEQPRLAATLRRNFGDGSILNLNGAFGLNHFDVDEISPARPIRPRLREFHEQEREYNYELGGDYEFGLGGGRLKLIGLRRFEHSPYSQNLTRPMPTPRPTFGQRFTQVADETETIARANIAGAAAAPTGR